MFCPKCGSNQGKEKKFCTVCGTNLIIVSQALTGQLHPPQIIYQAPTISNHEIERQQQMRKGITMAVLGGGYLVYKLLSSIFFIPLTGWRSPFGTLGFIAFIIFAIGIAKIVSSKATNADLSPTTNNTDRPVFTPASNHPSFLSPRQRQDALPQPVFSAASSLEQSGLKTSELEPLPCPTTSVTEDDTRQLSR